MTKHQKPIVRWSLGTAYDLFASLHVLHHPERFGLRGSWAAGVRSRLAPSQRCILEDAQYLFFSTPISWVSALPEPRDAESVLKALAQLDPADRLPTLADHADVPPQLLQILREVKSRGSWNQTDLVQLQIQLSSKRKTPLTR